MRIESVTAHNFGPFANQTIDLAPGMTIIHGPNESGKSSWHAALYAGLCGVRRGRGRQQKEDLAFSERHHPWDIDAWEVSEIIRLEDGRRIELRHDLQGKVDCQANDADLGRDYSNEIIHDGAPDGARWLGLDRKSFLSTACIQQADILSVIGQANALQEHLQRAAATAGADATAAAALTCLEDYRRENVGQRANSKRPLPAARRTLGKAQIALEDAREAHAGYLNRLDEIRQLTDQAAHAENSLHLVQAARAVAQAQRTEGKFRRARELSSKYPDEPSDQTESNEIADAVKIALYQWNEQPQSVVLGGRSSADLHGELVELPSMPDGDTNPHESVSRAKVVFDGAHSRLQRHLKEKPANPQIVATADLDAPGLRALADELAIEEPTVDPGILERLERARQRAGIRSQAATPEHSDNEASHVPLVIRPLKILVRVVLAIFGRFLKGFGRGADQAAQVRALEELRSLETEHVAITFRIDEVRRRRGSAKDRAKQNDLPLDPSELVKLARKVEDADLARLAKQQWEREADQRGEELDEAESVLREALKGRGITDLSSTIAAAEQYTSECKRLGAVAKEASRRPNLQQAFEARQREEVVVADIEKRRRDASKRLRDTAKAVGLVGNSEEELAPQLQSWVAEYDRSLQERELARQQLGELQLLLDGGTLQVMEDTATQQRHQANEAAIGLMPIEIEKVEITGDGEAQLSTLRQEQSEAASSLATRQGSLQQYTGNMASVPEAEEELARAKANLARIEQLDFTLRKTQEILDHAQDKVHRTVAPILRDTIKPWLRLVTDGRYTEVRVDPESLEVTVSSDGKKWPKAELLSRGTAEQIYLLLRVAMARHLTIQGEICPLILDDVTVNCDPERQARILDLLHEISSEQQVILFSQEPETLEWAEQNISEPRDLLVKLAPSAIPA